MELSVLLVIYSLVLLTERKTQTIENVMSLSACFYGKNKSL